MTVYARFRVNTFTVTAKAYYRTSTSGSYSAGGTGGTVQVASAAAGAESATSVVVNHSVLLRATPAAGYIFDGWYSSTSATSALSNSESYTYTLGDYSAKNVYARFRKGDIYLTGWINGAAVTTNQSALKFTHGANADEYQLTYTFTGNQAGFQYITIKDSSLSGNNIYHPENTDNAKNVSGNPATAVDTSPNGEPKWRVDATSHDVATFTWNNSTKTPTWNLTKYYYFDVSGCWWYLNDSCLPSISYNNGVYKQAEYVSDKLYRAAIPESVTTFSLGRNADDNASDAWNKFDITIDRENNYNKYSVNSDSNGGSWSMY